VLHRVGRVLRFSPVVRILTSPTPRPQASVLPPVLGLGAHSLEREGWESPNSDDGTYSVVLFIHVYMYVLYGVLVPDKIFSVQKN
jgi:hypothetical protein